MRFLLVPLCVFSGALAACGGDDTEVTASGTATTAATDGATSEPTVEDVLKAESVACGSAPAAASGPLQAEVLVANAQVSAGGTTPARVNLRNTGSTALDIGDGSPLEALLLKSGTRDVMSRQRLEVEPGTAGNPAEPLQAGGSLTLPVIVGTQRCDASPGENVPAGDYELIVLVTATGDQMVPSTPAVITVAG